MIAQVKTQAGTVYYTAVFAIFGKGGSCTVIGFDENFETLQCIPFYASPNHYRQQVMIVETTRDNWVQDGDLEGYDWIVNDQKRLEHIRLGRLLHPDFVARGKALQDEVNVPEWWEVTDQKTANDIRWATADFHDAVILSMEQTETDAILQFEIWGGTALLRLENAEFHKLCEIGAHGEEFYSAHITFEGGKVHFRGYGSEVDEDDAEEGLRPMIFHFSCARLYWKVELETVTFDQF